MGKSEPMHVSNCDEFLPSLGAELSGNPVGPLHAIGVGQGLSTGPTKMAITVGLCL